LFSLFLGVITVKATRRNAFGRIIDKGAYCCFCGKWVCRLVRHLLDCHSTEKDVIHYQLLNHPDEKKSAALVLRNQGNWQHNCSVLAAGQGEMIVARAPADVSNFDHHDYTPCDLCYGYFKETEMYRHDCPMAGPGKKPRVKAGRVIARMAEFGISQGVATVLEGIQDDEVGRVAKTDELLLSWLSFHCNTGFWKQNKWKRQTRAKMRLAARLLLELHNTFPGASLREVLVKGNFDEITEATKACALNSKKQEALQVPLKMGHMINSLLTRMHSQASIANDDAALKDVSAFQDLMKNDWGVTVTTACHFGIKERRRNEKPCIPTTDDNVKFADHCKSKLKSALREFEEDHSVANYRALQKATLVRMLQFNRRRGGEVAEVRIEDFNAALDRSVLIPDVIFKRLTPEQQEAARKHRLLVVNGKCNQNNNIILTDNIICAIQLLIQYREVAGIDPDNQFIFAIAKSKASTLDASKVRGEFAAEADVKNMVVRGMRKYIATTLQVFVHNCNWGFVEQIVGKTLMLLITAKIIRCPMSKGFNYSLAESCLEDRWTVYRTYINNTYGLL
jgi:hypothetical protein